LALQAPVESFDSMANINNLVTLITFYKHCKKVPILFVVCSGLASDKLVITGSIQS